jgi:hypothetical protein
MNKTKRKNTHSKTKKKTSVFTRKHYNSNDGMLTTVWGPSTWHLLHTMSFNYPVYPTCEDKRNYRDFILSLQYVLPCSKCRKNLKENFKKLPLKMSHMENRQKFSLYVYKLHELVNKMLNKKSGLSYADVRERYEHFRSRCAKSIEELKKEHEEIMKTNPEKGCTEPLYGEKAKCILKIVPDNIKCDTFDIDQKCMKQKLHFT